VTRAVQAASLFRWSTASNHSHSRRWLVLSSPPFARCGSWGRCRSFAYFSCLFWGWAAAGCSWSRRHLSVGAFGRSSCAFRTEGVFEVRIGASWDRLILGGGSGDRLVFSDCNLPSFASAHLWASVKLITPFLLDTFCAHSNLFLLLATHLSVARLTFCLASHFLLSIA
jgi:hypothetical protein